MSAADLMSVLLASHLKYDFDQPEHPNNDSLIFSKGHACPLLYAAYKAAGALQISGVGCPSRRLPNWRSVINSASEIAPAAL